MVWTLPCFPDPQVFDLYAGTRVTIYGIAAANNQSASTVMVDFDLDGVPAGTFNSTPGAPRLFHVPFFHADGLDATEHTVVMKTSSPEASFLDYIIYRSEVPTTNATGGDEQGGTSPVQGVTASVAPIIGAVVGGVLVLAAIAALIVLLVRRRRAKGKGDDEEFPDDASFLSLVPFAYHPDTRQNNTEVSAGTCGTLPAAKFSGTGASKTALWNTVPGASGVEVGVGMSRPCSIASSLDENIGSCMGEHAISTIVGQQGHKHHE